MAGYLKRIALIKTVSKGFSSDGGELSGLVKCEVYAGFLKVELSLVNFAPLAEGKYRCGVSDGKQVLVFDEAVFETQVDFDLSAGFAALVCFCKDGCVKAVASAVCGDNRGEVAAIESAVAEQEKADIAPSVAYEDEAIAEVNYYELEVGKGGGAVRADKEEEKVGRAVGEDEEDSCAVENSAKPEQGKLTKGVEEKSAEGVSDGVEQVGNSSHVCGGVEQVGNTSHEAAEGSSADVSDDGGQGRSYNGRGDGSFYRRIEGDVKRIFADYPKEERLEKVIEGSRWAKIGYGNGKYYAFGVIYSDGEAVYLCYGVPSSDGRNCPRSLAGRASYVPVEGGGFWVMYQAVS